MGFVSCCFYSSSLDLPVLDQLNETCDRHTAAPPTTFGTVMNYVSLRLLGMDAEEPVMVVTRAWIHKMGKLKRIRLNENASADLARARL